ncbi:MAG: filament integrity protein fraC [Richelia sp. RM2_1_2]|nr:filament integrity protein fraC [Richelia sp. SM2_1_7]NJM17504.1 filament integrity protein fraC [Richelia sp. SM1_7_0]NJN08957.1 filament integrity protein fraC [Richelia sp. RM1_1_1]NJO26653.1 filament integrity protein fraC [Richelia sp. SL_2_1]NJO57697.1 filament integrity protein fraC [Richelia sp. RM2_1_2]
MPNFDFSDYFRAFPFGLIIFDFLFLLVAIPIEAYILNKRLKFDKRTSAFYAISINVFSNAIGWIVFFLIEPSTFFSNYRLGLISFLLYNRIEDNIYGDIVLAAFITFFGTLVVKFGLLRLLIIALSEPEEKKTEPEPEDSILVSRKTRRGRKSLQSTSLLTTTLIANSLSYSAITLVILFRILARTNLNLS